MYRGLQDELFTRRNEPVQSIEEGKGSTTNTPLAGINLICRYARTRKISVHDRVSPERGPKRSNTLSTQSSLPTPLTHSRKVGSRLGINLAFNIRQDQDTFSSLSGSEAQVQRTLTMVESSILPNLYNTDRNLLMLLNHEAIQKLIPT